MIDCPMGVLWTHTFSSLIPSIFLDSSYCSRSSPETASPICLTRSSCPGSIGKANATTATSLLLLPLPAFLFHSGGLLRHFRRELDLHMLDTFLLVLLFGKIQPPKKF